MTSLATADVRNLWAAAERLTNVDFTQFIIDAYPDVIAPWAAAAADFAATWFEESVDTTAVIADPIPIDRLKGLARWALSDDGGTQTLPKLEGTGQRAVFDGARDTTILNVENNNMRWARDARADACAFCRLLATKTQQLYTSRYSAIRVVGRRGRPRGARDVGEKYHDYCYCVPVEVPDLQNYQLPEHAQQWEDELAKARANAGSGNLKAILAAWRAQTADIK